MERERTQEGARERTRAVLQRGEMTDKPGARRHVWLHFRGSGFRVQGSDLGLGCVDDVRVHLEPSGTEHRQTAPETADSDSKARQQVLESASKC
eukprot:2077340-Rhodomonas_salina.2